MDCSECKYRSYQGDNLHCIKGHKPRFFMPKSPLDRNYGWKRVGCVDYAERISDGADECLSCRCGSVNFHILRNGNAECAKCQSVHEKRNDRWIYLG